MINDLTIQPMASIYMTSDNPQGIECGFEGYSQEAISQQ